MFRTVYGRRLLVAAPLLAAAVAVVAATGAFRSPAASAEAARIDCASAGPRQKGGAHAYFESLLARPECFAAYSLRDQAQLDQYKAARRKPASVTYDPAADKDPRRQDAAKLVIPAGKVSLQNQLRVPMGTSDGTATLVTWDAWFGSEFRYDKTSIGTYKTFQFSKANGDEKWLGIRTDFKQSLDKQARRVLKESGAGTALKKYRKGQEPPDSGAQPPEKGTAKKARAAASEPSAATAPPPARADRSSGNGIGLVEARGSLARPHGPNVIRDNPLAPQVGQFAVRGETWTRYWVLIEQRAEEFDLVSMWVADENNDPVQLLDRLQITVKGDVASFWLEYNTSSKPIASLGERVGYVRNIAMLRNVKDIAGLLQRPVR